MYKGGFFMNNKTERDSISVLCEGFTKALKDALLTKKIGEKIVITGEVSANDCVNGITVDIKRIK